MLAMHFFKTTGPASRGALAYEELVGLDGRGGGRPTHPPGGPPPGNRRMAAPAVETKRLIKGQRPPEAGPVAVRKRMVSFQRV
jgi:hypothetical protein